MKTVLSPEMVAHSWANQTQNEARNSGNTFYFNGDTIYSYGSHFPIARHTQSVVLFTTDKYRQTTAKHMSIVRRAIPSFKKVFFVTNVMASTKAEHAQNVVKMFEYISGLFNGLQSARKKTALANSITLHMSELEKYVDVFGVKLLKYQKDTIAANKAVISRNLDKWVENEAERRKIANAPENAIKREKAKAKKFAEQIQKFRNFEVKDLSHSLGLGNTALLRYNTEKQRVETSKGVQIPVELAKRFYKWVKMTIKKGGCIGDCNYKILDFEVRAVNENELIVGCHTVAMSEADAIANLLKW